MKKIVSVLMIMVMCLCLCSCGEKGKNTQSQDMQTNGEQNQDTQDKDTQGQDIQDAQISETDDANSTEIVWDLDMTYEELETKIQQDTENTVAALSEEWETLKSDVDTYEKYLENMDLVEAFYEKIYDETELLAIRLREYCLIYAKMIVGSDMSYDDMYDELESIHDSLYEDAGEVIHDDIYDGILDEMYEYYYDGILDDAYEDAEYSEWSDARSEEYGWWSDARSDVYGEYSDYRSDSYGLYSDLRGEIYSEDMEDALDDIEDFEKDIQKMKD